MIVVDPADQTSWPDDIASEVWQLTEQCRTVRSNKPTRHSYELTLGGFEEDHATERAFRDLFCDRHIAMFHATRLLPHEIASVRVDGLTVIGKKQRSARLDRVVEIYGAEFGSDRFELLRGAGPLYDNGANGRVGKLWGVTPLQIAFDEGGHGMTVFLKKWGGECFYWCADESVELKESIDFLTERSTPAIVCYAVTPSKLNTYTKLWSIFVAQFGGWPSPWHEFYVEESIPAEQVVEILSPGSAAWPLAPNVNSVNRATR